MEIDRAKYKVWDKNHFNIIHAKLNPGLAFNELILGQRFPKILLIDQTSDKPLMERTYIPCPHCETYHDGRTWSSLNKTGFRNWFGLFCPNCEEIIPCIRNWTSLLILTLTLTFWFWWINSWKQSWLKKQPARYANIDVKIAKHKKINWLKIGLLWGSSMFIIMTGLMILILGVDHYLKLILINFPVWMIGGLGFGYSMKKQMGKKV